MRLAVACGALALAASLSGCSSTPAPPPEATPPELPLDVGSGHGSEFGNYATLEAGETKLPTGERCTVYVWDRPYTKGTVIRYRSASCESRDHPNWMTARDLGHEIIPMAESNLRDEVDGVGQ
jgi:hypothetical protein